MVFRKQKSTAQILKEIAEQRKRIAKEEVISKRITEKQKLSQQLFELKQRKLIGAGAKAKRLSAKFGRGLLKAGQKVAPVIQKQARLIREQQLRDDAIMSKREKSSKKLTKRRKKKGRKTKQTPSQFDGLIDLPF